MHTLNRPGVNPNGVRSDTNFMDPAVAVYASAALGIVRYVNV